LLYLVTSMTFIKRKQDLFSAQQMKKGLNYMSNKLLPQYSIFFNKANTDLKVAEYLLNSEDEEIDMEAIYFHLQQASEKYIKSLLSFNKIHFEKIHDISPNNS